MRSSPTSGRMRRPGARSQEPGARSQEPGARSQEPGGVGVAQVVSTDVEVDAGLGDGRQSDAGAEGVARDRGAVAGGEQQIAGTQVPRVVKGFRRSRRPLDRRRVRQRPWHLHPCCAAGAARHPSTARASPRRFGLSAARRGDTGTASGRPTGRAWGRLRSSGGRGRVRCTRGRPSRPAPENPDDHQPNTRHGPGRGLGHPRGHGRADAPQ